MHREIHSWYSPTLGKEMEIAIYGHFGYALLIFPTAAADYLENERFYLIDAMSESIESGKVKVFSINSINRESWMNGELHPSEQAYRHQQYDNYVRYEVIPFIHHKCNGRVKLITTGASFGALHAANTFFKHSDVVDGTIPMSGFFSLLGWSDGYVDDNVYFNSPADYLKNLNDPNILNQLRTNKEILLLTGQGNYEKPERTVELSNILNSKGIPHKLDLWGHDMHHDWPTWRKMVSLYV
ncbi:esterase family protein [bacterium]|nr:esterase family protein [bacterium]